MLPRLLRSLLLAIAAASVIAIVALTRADVDLWGHVRFGLDMLESRTLERVDPYSFTSDRPWVNHEWLSEVIIALAWQAGGSSGLIFLKLICTAAALTLTALTLAKHGVTGRPRIMLLGLALVGILPRVTQVRPQLFSVVLFAALLFVFARASRPSAGRQPFALLWASPILALWANLHGGWIVGVGTVAMWCLGETWIRRASIGPSIVPLACAAAAAAATLLNPYGVGLWAFLLETVRFGREAISEWGPAWSNRTTMIVWSCFAALTTLALRRIVRAESSPDTRNPAAVAIPILWGIAALRVSRLDAFFALSVIGLLAGPLGALFNRRRAAAEPLPFAWQAGALAAAVIAVSVVPVSRSALTCIGIHSQWPEPEAVAFLSRGSGSPHVVTYFDWGEYAIWHLPPGSKVSMDGRRETVYSDDVVRQHLDLYLGKETGLRWLDTPAAHVAWLPAGIPAAKALAARGWAVLFEGPRSVILGAPWVARVASAKQVTVAAPGPRCFPGP